MSSLGVRGWLSLEGQLRSSKFAQLMQYRLRSKSLQSPLEYRPNDSDLEAFLQVFVRREYDAIGPIAPGGLIIDCGANVGYSSARLLMRHPGAHVIAVEPDAGNFRLLQKNLSSFGSSVIAIEGAVWSRDCGLVFDRDAFRDGLSWSVQVREAAENESADVRAFDISSLMQMRGDERVALLKMDVERSELEIFRTRPDWITQCDNIAIELHDQECERTFFSAIADEGFHVTRSGELTICSRARS